MSSLMKSELKKTFKRTDARVLLLLGLWPALLSILVVIKPDVFQMAGNQLGAFEFANYMIIIQNDIFLPLLVTVLIASISLYQEIHKKTIYLYKDINRASVLNSKYVSVYSVYFTFLIIYIIISYVFYFVAFSHHNMASGTWIAYPEDTMDILYTVVQIVLGATFYIHVGILLAIRTTTGMSVFGMTLFYMFAKIVPNFKFLKLIFPIGYKEVLNIGNHPYLVSMLISIAIYALYHIVLYTFNKRTFEHLQFN